MANSVGLQGRVELWSRALYAIQDFPLTGCGLGTFRQVVHLLYPPFFVEPGADLAHAHNFFLQVALDLGVPGLIAYLALLGTALWAGWRLLGSPNSRQISLTASRPEAQESSTLPPGSTHCPTI